MAIHPTAIVEDGAKIGDGVDIGPFCFVARTVQLAAGVRLDSHVVVAGETRIGARSRIASQAVIGGKAQVRKGDFENGRLTVGEDCIFREGVTINLGSAKGAGLTQVGDRAFIMAYSHIGHDCIVGDDVTFANSATLAGHVTVGNGVNIGGLSAIQQFCRIGNYAMVGGVTGINRDVIPYGMAFGDHAILSGLNIVGLKRQGLERSAIHVLRAAYRLIFKSREGTLIERAKTARETWPDARVQEIVSFILAESKQALCTAHEAA